MNKITRSWVQKAEHDFRVAERLLRTWETGFGDAVCFHCQQSAEKYLKARLVDAGLPFPRTHDLSALLTLLLPQDALLRSFEPACDLLTKFAVDVRYPGDNPTKRAATRAVKLATSLRQEMRVQLGLRP